MFSVQYYCCLFSETMMKTKWKCKQCDKILASRQTATHHLKVFHKDCDPSEGITMVKVQVSESDSNNMKKCPKVKKPESKAYGFFSSLSNVFTDNKLVESFAWGKPEGVKTGGGKGDPVTSSTATMSLDRTGTEPTETIAETLELNNNKTITGSSTVTSGADKLMDLDMNCS